MDYELAVEASRKAKGKQKKQYDKKARPAAFQDSMNNRWEKEPYIVVDTSICG